MTSHRDTPQVEQMELLEHLTNPPQWPNWTSLQRREWQNRMESDHQGDLLTLGPVVIKDVIDAFYIKKVIVECEERLIAEFSAEHHRQRLLYVERTYKITIKGMVKGLELESSHDDFMEPRDPLPVLRLINCSFTPCDEYPAGTSAIEEPVKEKV